MSNDKAFKVKNGLELAGYDTSKAVTAVDVFVYDTSRDSDGGAWRKRTQGTSWYNETLNTATRGARREFPAVAVIVAETNKVTIYDGDDPSLPMWMVFETTNKGIWVTGLTGVSAINGHLSVSGVGPSYFGWSDVNFISETFRFATNSGQRILSNTVEGRNLIAVIASTDAAKAIVNSIANDVAMTVLPDAPIDPATGLPVPTIAVATAGGVSVIKDDGTVVDSALTSATSGVYFTDDGFLLVHRGGTSSATYTYIVENITADGFSQLALLNEFSVPALVPNSTTCSEFIDAGDFKARGGANKNGVSLLALNSASVASSMVAYTTSTYHTGWMNGDIKGAFLSDTDDTDLVGSGELVTNGTFDTDVSGWSNPTDGRSTASFASGKLRITNDTGGNGYAYQTLSLTVGKTYTVSWDVSPVGSTYSTRVYWGNAEGTTSGGGASAAAAVTGTQSITFVAQAATTYFAVQLFTTASGPTVQMDFDNVSIRLADADRSVNNKGLIVNGTVTRSPVATGADLVAYSGFSASNYLEQPYNSALDFGTGDFCVMGWVKTTGLSECILHRSITTGGIFIQVTSGGRVQIYATGTSSFGNALAGTASVSNGSWNFVTIKRTSGVMSIFVNGVQDGAAANTANLTYVNAVTRVGLRRDGLEPWDNGSLALLRISATAPTAEQIEKIYNDEKFLFQENAQATLYGASDAVTALAFDDTTQMLHVGTSAGRSVFSGLRRVSNTTTAVGTAISASNGLVAEE